MRTALWRYAFLFVVAGSVWALDQMTKMWIRQNLALGEMIPVLYRPLFVRIVHWYNRGGVFGLFQEFSLGWTIMALVITGLLVRFYPHLAQDTLLRWALAFQLGGALGNLTDRIRLGHVTDFIAVEAFPVFNLADVSITLGIGLLLWSAWRGEGEDEPVQETHPAEPLSTTEPDSSSEPETSWTFSDESSPSGAENFKVVE